MNQSVTRPGGTAVGISGGRTALRPEFVQDVDFLRAQAIATFDACKFTFTGGTFAGQPAWKAGGGSTYDGYVVWRDQAMMVRSLPSYFTASQTGVLCDACVSCQGVQDAGVQTALTVGGSVVGYGAQTGLPSDLDNGYEAVDLHLSHARMTGSASKFAANETKLLAAHGFPTLSDHLPYIDPAGARPPGWGFNDSEIITGRDAMLAVMRHRSCAAVAEMLTMLGRTGDAAPFLAELPLIRAAILSHLYDSSRGLLRFSDDSANANSALFSVMASAYAVVTDAVQGAPADAIAAALIDLLPGGSAYASGERGFYQGQARHFTSTTAGFTVFRNQSFALGTYQNGGGWATGTGWAARAIARLRPDLGLRLIVDWSLYCQGQAANVRPVETVNLNGSVQAAVYGASNLPLQFFAPTFDR